MVIVQKVTKRTHGKVRVTFTMPAMENCGCLYLVGNFSGLNESVYRMNLVEDGSWSLTLELEEGREYPYLFRTLDGAWLEDPNPHPRCGPFKSMDVSVQPCALRT